MPSKESSLRGLFTINKYVDTIFSNKIINGVVNCQNWRLGFREPTCDCWETTQFFLPKLDDIDVDDKAVPHAIQSVKQFN